MDWWAKVLTLAIALGMDAMSVSMAVGVRWHGARQRFRLAFHMGLFQFIMPLIGWMIGVTMAQWLAGVGRYLAAFLVFALGVKMLYEVVTARPGSVAESAEHAVEKEFHVKRKDPTRGLALILLAIATSIDALVVGFSLAIKGESVWRASVVIGIVAALMVLMGVAIGKKAGTLLGRYAELAGAIVLMLLGLSFLWF